MRVTKEDLRIFEFDFRAPGLLGLAKWTWLYLTQFAPVFIGAAGFPLVILFTIVSPPFPTWLGILVGGFGFCVAFSRSYLLRHLSFAILYHMKKAGDRVMNLSLFLLVTLAVLYALIGLTPTSLLLRYLSQLEINEILLGLVALLLLGFAVTSYGNVFDSQRFCALCFRQAAEIKAKLKKERWTKRAIRELKNYLASFDLDLDNSIFERELARKIVNGEDVDLTLRRLANSIYRNKGTVSILRGLAKSEANFITLRRGTKERAASFDALLKGTKLLSVVVGILLAILGALGIIPLLIFR